MVEYTYTVHQGNCSKEFDGQSQYSKAEAYAKQLKEGQPKLPVFIITVEVTTKRTCEVM